MLRYQGKEHKKEVTRHRKADFVTGRTLQCLALCTTLDNRQSVMSTQLAVLYVVPIT
jgi:hypothetical protein